MAILRLCLFLRRLCDSRLWRRWVRQFFVCVCCCGAFATGCRGGGCGKFWAPPLLGTPVLGTQLWAVRHPSFWHPQFGLLGTPKFGHPSFGHRKFWAPLVTLVGQSPARHASRAPQASTSPELGTPVLSTHSFGHPSNFWAILGSPAAGHAVRHPQSSTSPQLGTLGWAPGEGSVGIVSGATPELHSLSPEVLRTILRLCLFLRHLCDSRLSGRWVQQFFVCVCC